MQFAYKVLLLFYVLSHANGALAQTKIATEERFQDLFITAGYSTAFGAALGAAVLGLSDNPGTKMRYLAIGASVGFIAGSILGTYIVFSPMIVPGGTMTHIGLQKDISYGDKRSLMLRPILNEGRLQSFQADWVLAKF